MLSNRAGCFRWSENRVRRFPGRLPGTENQAVQQCKCSRSFPAGQPWFQAADWPFGHCVPLSATHSGYLKTRIAAASACSDALLPGQARPCFQAVFPPCGMRCPSKRQGNDAVSRLNGRRFRATPMPRVLTACRRIPLRMRARPCGKYLPLFRLRRSGGKWYASLAAIPAQAHADHRPRADGALLPRPGGARPGFVGIFYAAVKTTGIFCTATCRARKPKPENVAF